jgi:ankyrin repeat protein
VKILLKGKAKVNARDSAGSTALTVAVLRGYAEVVKTLIAAGADVKKDKTELLEIANREHHPEVAKIIEEAARK